MSDEDLESAFLQALTPLGDGDRFRFACHPGVPCFNECCADLHLELSPYDVLRLRAALGLPSREFLRRYTRLVRESDSELPHLFLTMADDPRRRCQLVSEHGCTVYADRPGACRTYPLGRGASIDAAGEVVTRYVVIREDHCRGFAEAGEFTVDSWLADQNIEPYNRANDRYLGFQTAWRRPGGPPRRELLGLAVIALFRLDDFEQLIAERGIFEELGVEPARRDAVLADQSARLDLAFDWLDRLLAG